MRRVLLHEDSMHTLIARDCGTDVRTNSDSDDSVALIVNSSIFRSSCMNSSMERPPCVAMLLYSFVA